MSAMLAQQQQLQLLQQHALLGAFNVPSTTVTGAAHNPMGSSQHSPSPTNTQDVKSESSNSLKADTAAAASSLEASQSQELPLEFSSKPDTTTQKSRVDAHVMLEFEEDKYYLSDLQCILRGEFIEAFGCGKVRSLICHWERERRW